VESRKSPSPDDASRQWREELRRELGRRVPPAWRDRLLEELADHWSDLQEETKSMDAASPLSPHDRLGSPQTIAAAAVAECKTLGFFARRPLVTYVAGPIMIVPVMVVVVLFAGVFALGLALESAFWLLGLDPLALSVTVDNIIAQLMVLPLRFLPFALAAWFFCRLTRRHGRGWQSVLTACTIVALYALAFTVTLTPKTADEKGFLMIGLGLPKHLFNFLQAATPLAIAWLFLRPAAGAASSQLPAATCGVGLRL
jgi:hypothetical protein